MLAGLSSFRSPTRSLHTVCSDEITNWPAILPKPGERRRIGVSYPGPRHVCGGDVAQKYKAHQNAPFWKKNSKIFSPEEPCENVSPVPLWLSTGLEGRRSEKGRKRKGRGRISRKEIKRKKAKWGKRRGRETRLPQLTFLATPLRPRCLHRTACFL